MDQWERVEVKLDRIVDKQAEMNVTLGKQQVSIDEHIKRTNLLEERMKPIEKHVSLMDAGMKIIGGLAVLLTILEGIHTLFK